MDKNRELNEWIAINLMGWRWGDEFISFAAGSRKVLLPPKDSRFGGKVIPDWAGDEGLAIREVVAKMRERGYCVEMWSQDYPDLPMRWSVKFKPIRFDRNKPGGSAVVDGDALALAITLAAKSALESESKSAIEGGKV